MVRMKQKLNSCIPTYKAALEACYGHEVSEQEAFNALLEQTELIRVLDEIDRALSISKSEQGQNGGVL